MSVGDLQARIDQWVTLKTTLGEEADVVEPAVRHPRPPLQTEYVAPADALERALAGIWQELLGVDRVGANDSFFELGGDSLLGLQVIARVKKQLSVSVSAVSLYEEPTVARLAGVIRAAGTPVGLGQSRDRGDRRREAEASAASRRRNGGGGSGDCFARWPAAYCFWTLVALLVDASGLSAGHAQSHGAGVARRSGDLSVRRAGFGFAGKGTSGEPCAECG